MAEYDVLVVGAGPGGATAARAAAASGLRTLLIEEHDTVGVPNHCTGKLSHHAFREFDLPASLAVNSVSAAVFHSSGGVSIHVNRRTVDSYVVDRVAFDRWLAARAQDAGAALATGVCVTALCRERGALVVRGTRRRGGAVFEARCRLLIDAEGAAPRLPGALGVRIERRFALGLQYQMRGVGAVRADTPEMFFGQQIAPGFFAWLMPLGGGRARIGVAVDPRASRARGASSPMPEDRRDVRAPSWYLDRLLDTHPALRRRVAGAVIEQKVAGRIPLMGPRPATIGRDVLLVGDAAGHVKATSGGGIYFAMLGGHLAGQAAARYVAGDRSAAADYERRWRARFGREVAFTAFARRVINRLSDGELDAVMRLIADSPAIRRSVEAAGDTQYQSRVFLPLLRGLAAAAVRRPALLPLAGAALVQGMLAQV